MGEVIWAMPERKHFFSSGLLPLPKYLPKFLIFYVGACCLLACGHLHAAQVNIARVE